MTARLYCFYGLVAKLVYATDSKSVSSECRFESDQAHQYKAAHEAALLF